jgi:hypothetical protein
MKRWYSDIPAISLFVLAVILAVFAFTYPTYKIRLAAAGAVILLVALIVSKFPISILLKILFSIGYFAFIYTANIT